MKSTLLIISFLLITASVFAQTHGMEAGNTGAALDLLMNAVTADGGGNITVTGTVTSAGGAGDLLADGTVPLSANWDVGAFSLTMLRLISDQATGTAPFTVASTTVVTNLNADLLDGESAAAFEDADATIIKQADVDDTPVNAVTTAPVSSNWAYDHANDADQHPEYLTEAAIGAAYDTSAELDALFAAKSAVITEGSIPNDTILEEDLKAVDAAADEECLTYEVTTGDFEWQACGSGSGDLLADGTVPLSANWDVGAYSLTMLRLISDQTTGTAPFTVASTTVVTNLNADLLDGESAAAFQDADADLTTYAGITPSANIQSLMAAANYAAMRTLLDLEAGTDFYSVSAADTAFEAADATLTDIADGTIVENLVNTANPWAIDEGGTGAATASAARTALGVVPGTHVQAYNANLTAIDQALVTTSSPTFASLTTNLYDTCSDSEPASYVFGQSVCANGGVWNPSGQDWTGFETAEKKHMTKMVQPAAADCVGANDPHDCCTGAGAGATCAETWIVESDVLGNSYISTIQAASNVIASAGVITLTAAQMNSVIVMTAAGDVNIPADQCDTATGQKLVVKSTAAHLNSLTSNDASDQFILTDGTALTATHELDLAGTAGAQVAVMCIQANKWWVMGQIGTCVTGGAAD